MKRLNSEPRPEWRERVEANGLTYHTRDNDDPYWVEDACYAVREDEARVLAEVASQAPALFESGLQAIMSDPNRAQQLLQVEGIPKTAFSGIMASYNEHSPGIVDVVNLAWNPEEGNPVILSMQAGMPYGFAEQAAQQAWLLDTSFDGFQFAGLDEYLPAAFAALGLSGETVHVLLPAVEPIGEKFMNSAYWVAALVEAGAVPFTSVWPAITLASDGSSWVDHQGEPIKRYLLAGSIAEVYEAAPEFAEQFFPDPRGAVALEPLWRQLLSSRFVLTASWGIDKGNPLLLETRVGNPGDLDGSSTVMPISRSYLSLPVIQAAPPMLMFGENNEYAAFFDIVLVQGEPAALLVRERRAVDGAFKSLRTVPHILT